jgi:DNA-binding beta-propeller fold protein YncE
VYVAGEASNNVFRIAPSGAVRQLIDSNGDGAGNQLLSPFAVAVGPDGSVYVTGFASSNVFRIAPGGAITRILGQ